ncbi:zona pellucida sperm-binding protein 2-like [Bombina bombina]|uniref:zona pellucida sperm-binding protein 2-like n=1 Tax=Bombina bombina TaxID=8345 RepID=UPI00235AC1DA|nr:zona pellucida sperm-binding protein 2-like [Bombina bombina]
MATEWKPDPMSRINLCLEKRLLNLLERAPFDFLSGRFDTPIMQPATTRTSDTSFRTEDSMTMRAITMSNSQQKYIPQEIPTHAIQGSHPTTKDTESTRSPSTYLLCSLERHACSPWDSECICCSSSATQAEGTRWPLQSGRAVLTPIFLRELGEDSEITAKTSDTRSGSVYTHNNGAKGTNVPIIVTNHVTKCYLNVYFGYLFYIFAVHAQSLDFPGSFSCLNNEILLEKPEDFSWQSWQNLHVVDSSGGQIPDCDNFANGTFLAVPDRCLSLPPPPFTKQMGKRILHLAYLTMSPEQNASYTVVCNDVQSDQILEGSLVTCTKDFMSMLTVPVEPSYWIVIVTDDTRTLKLNASQTAEAGYTLTSDPSNLILTASLHATGIKVLKMENQVLYLGDIHLSSRYRSPNIIIDATMFCTGPPQCNATHMTILIPDFGSTLIGISLNNIDLPMTTSVLQTNGIAVDTRGGIHLFIKKSTLQVDRTAASVRYYIPSLLMTFSVEGLVVPMLSTPECYERGDPSSTLCTSDAYMNFEVIATATLPHLDLNSVRLGDGRCQPTVSSSDKLTFHVPLNECGTTIKFVGNKAIYENEIHALWKDFPPSIISRDSEYRLTIQCLYTHISDEQVIVNVATYPPFEPSKSDGPLSMVFNIYPDDSYTTAYGAFQYPIVKTLREPIYLEVQLLNRNDPNIELVLDDCWATTSQDPKAMPQWNVVVDGCKALEDNYQTVFHPVGSNVVLPRYRKRFEVKTFAFMSSGEATTDLIYFHCVAVVCNSLNPDYVVCSKMCPKSRRKRGKRSLKRDSTLVSIPGPVLFVNLHRSVISKGY